jgi:hypothetical protein
MTQYYKISPEKATQPTPMSPRRTVVASSRRPAVSRVAERFGMSSMFAVNTPDRHAQTTEQELQAYITGQLSPEGTDMIKFWEVRE